VWLWSLVVLLGAKAAGPSQSVAPETGPPTLAGRVLRGFPSPGDKPEGLAWDGQSLWCNNFNGGWLTKLDPTDGRILAQYQGQGLPANPEGLAWDGQHLWTCDWHTGVIVKLRETAGGIEVLGSFPKPADSGPNVGLEWDGSALWLTCWPDVSKGLEFGQLFRLDPVTVTAQERHVLPVRWVEDLAWDGRYLWSADWLSGIGFAIEASTGDTLHTFTTPGPNPVGTAWDGHNLWITDTERDSIYVLELDTPTPVRDTSWGAMKARYRGP
jgi:hypothetical protein